MKWPPLTNEQIEKRDEKISKSIKEAFILEVGLIPVEIGHAYPASYESVINTEDRTWYGRLTLTGKHKKGTFVEDK